VVLVPTTSLRVVALDFVTQRVISTSSLASVLVPAIYTAIIIRSLATAPAFAIQQATTTTSLENMLVTTI
jgi:hypothetical protein